jgi:hypothetical protein
MPIPPAEFGELMWVVGGYFFLASVVKKIRPVLLPSSAKRISARSAVLVGCHAVSFGCTYVFPATKGDLFWPVFICGAAGLSSVIWDYLPN